MTVQEGHSRHADSRSKSLGAASNSSKRAIAEVVVLMLGVIVFGTLNNFAGKMKANTLGTYNFVSGIVDTWLHLVINAAIVALLMRNGSVNRTQLRYVFKCASSWQETGIWKYIAIASVSDVANGITGLASQPYLTTLMMSMMDQATTPFTVITSFFMLGTRYSALESGFVLLLIAAAVSGVLVAQASNSGENSPFWATFAAATTGFAAVSFVLKEFAFREYAAYRSRLNSEGYVRITDKVAEEADQGEDEELPERLSIFLVSVIISLGGVITSIPVALLNRWATEDGSPTEALSDAFVCLLNCDHAIETYLFYTAINFVYNFCLLALTSRGSALLAFLSLKVVVPLTALCSYFPWPFIGAKTVSPVMWCILVVMLCALVGFRYGNLLRERLLAAGARPGCFYPLCSSQVTKYPAEFPGNQ